MTRYESTQYLGFDDTNSTIKVIADISPKMCSKKLGFGLSYLFFISIKNVLFSRYA